MNKTFLLLPVLAACFLAGPVMAETATEMKENVKEGVTPPKTSAGPAYGMAGCGLGSVFFGNKTSILAATTNSSSGNQTFGITSGTSNCTDTAGGSQSAKAFIETNREALAKDISRGSGETIDSLATLGGCTDSKTVGVTLQKNFKRIFPTPTSSSDMVAASILVTLKEDATLGCSKII